MSPPRDVPELVAADLDEVAVLQPSALDVLPADLGLVLAVRGPRCRSRRACVRCVRASVETWASARMRSQSGPFPMTVTSRSRSNSLPGESPSVIRRDGMGVSPRVPARLPPVASPLNPRTLVESNGHPCHAGMTRRGRVPVRRRRRGHGRMVSRPGLGERIHSGGEVGRRQHRSRMVDPPRTRKPGGREVRPPSRASRLIVTYQLRCQCQLGKRTSGAATVRAGGSRGNLRTDSSDPRQECGHRARTLR